MKKILFTLSIGLTSIASYSNCVSAQNSAIPVSFSNSKIFKEHIHYMAALENPADLGTYIPDAKTINAKAVKDFQTRFTGETEAKWYSDKNGLVSYFVKDGYGDRVFYDKKGRWQYSLIYYDEYKLPRDIRSAVKSVYFDMSIKVVEEVQNNDGMAYIIYLEDKSSYKILNVTKDGEIQIMQELSK